MRPDELRALATRLDAAQEAVSRLIAGAFRRDGERLPYEQRPRFSIPARPDYDDDLTALAAIKDAATALRARAEEPTDAE